MVENFYEKQVWQDAVDLVINVYKLTSDFPVEERYGLISQIRRSANSVAANFAEGFERVHPKDKIRFYLHARGSLAETLSHAMVSERLKFMSLEDRIGIRIQTDKIGTQINAIINSLR